VLAIFLFALIVFAAWAFTQVFSGRGAFVHVGAFVGTIMAVNVFGIIIPNQKKIAAALMAGRAPDPALGAQGKQRSVHNNYLTLRPRDDGEQPLPDALQPPAVVAVVALIIVIGAAARHFLNRHDAGDPLAKIWWTLPVMAVGLAGALWLTAPRELDAGEGTVTEGEVRTILARHCVMCHSPRPSHEGFDAPPKGVVLVSLDDLVHNKAQVVAQAVHGDAMPLGNDGDDRCGARRAWRLRA
jgi:uncharacterized membrane protein